ncbi:MAG: T9SS type A sorting domain-containing protein [Burkholderiales bacterium]|nr:T9SS type A sorting domain-containing protein [Flavobacterium sp.]
MKKKYPTFIIAIVALLFWNALAAQCITKPEVVATLHCRALSDLNLTSPNYKRTTGNPPLEISTITPASQAICSGNSITPITATNPSIDGALRFDAVAGGATTYFDGPQSGVYFDLTNSGATPLRICGFRITAFTSANTSVDQQATFSFYKTTTATTASGNYNNASQWTNLATGAKAFPPTLANNGYLFNVNLIDNGFTLAAGAATGVYILCDAGSSSFRLGIRSLATTTGSLSNANLTLNPLVRATSQFTTDNQPNGFYGDVFYHTQTYGFWERDNFENIIGNIASPDLNSGVSPFPISDMLLNTSGIPQIANYTITSYNVYGTKYTMNAAVTVKPIPINTVTQLGNTLTADEIGAFYQWFECGSGNHVPVLGATEQTYTPPSNGNYGVTITLEDCPIDSDCRTVVLSNSAFNAGIPFSVYPNPNNGHFKVNVPVICQFSLVNQLGQIVHKFSVDAIGESIITIENLSDGVYYLKSETNQGNTVSKKIVVQNN